MGTPSLPSATGRNTSRGASAPVPVTMYGAEPSVDAITGLGAIGVTRVLLSVPTAPAAEALRVLDAYAELADAS